MENEFQLDYLPCQPEIFFNQSAKFVIVKKGRRFGFTQGCEKACIEWLLIDKISPILWVDTINGNIDRYVERFFIPDLKRLPARVKWDWQARNRVLSINGLIIDFRSADRPENIEGFGYKKIILNEAGIILQDDYLYSHAILPMLLDYQDSQLIAAGVPKGKYKKDGNKHKFYELYENAKAGKSGYKLLEYTTYDNPLISKEAIELLMLEMSQAEADQEIYGNFVEYAGNNPFAHQYNPDKHESKQAVFNPLKQLIISVDFNLNPFAVTFRHIWQDQSGVHYHVFDEAEIKQGSIPAMIDLIKSKYGSVLGSARLTGDAMGNQGELSQRDNASYYLQLMRGLKMSPTQLKIVGNPTHENSRSDVNYVLSNHSDYKINPDTCPNLCRDMKSVQCDAFGDILKKNRKDLNQRADYLDTERYGINTFLKPWILQHQKQHGFGRIDTEIERKKQELVNLTAKQGINSLN